MKLTKEQWEELEVLCGEIADAAARDDPMWWDDSELYGEGIRTRLAEILGADPESDA